MSDNQKTSVYLAGGFRSNWQEKLITTLGETITFYNPREHGLNKPDQYTLWDTHYVQRCDILFAYMEADNPSGYGLTFEVGLAKALSKTIILVDERSDSDESFSKYFKIVHSSSDVVFGSFEEGLELLKTFAR